MSLTEKMILHDFYRDKIFNHFTKNGFKGDEILKKNFPSMYNGNLDNSLKNVYTEILINTLEKKDPEALKQFKDVELYKASKNTTFKDVIEDSAIMALSATATLGVFHLFTHKPKSTIKNIVKISTDMYNDYTAYNYYIDENGNLVHIIYYDDGICLGEGSYY